jgi:glutamate dehydrogenase/leucine dehydrogenase
MMPRETPESLESLLHAWDGEDVVMRHDWPTGTWILIAIHSTRLGPAAGGTRMKSYSSLADALRDAQRLAEAMTYKFALSGLPRGGGKAVLAVPEGLHVKAREGLLRRYGTLVAQLGGLYSTGPDVGTTALDMDIIAETGAPYVFGRSLERGGAGDSGPATAIGVLAAIRLTCARLFGTEDLTGRRVVVQGAGSVGLPLLRLLAEAGADIAYGDVNPLACERAHAELGLLHSSPETLYDAECDVFAPCALGAVLSEVTIPRLRCRAVVGSANNQLATPEDADRLAARGILYAPDFVVNSGGAVWLLGRESLGWSAAEAGECIADTIRRTLDRVYSLAEERAVTTTAAAQAVAEERLAAGPTEPTDL